MKLAPQRLAKQHPAAMAAAHAITALPTISRASRRDARDPLIEPAGAAQARRPADDQRGLT